MDSKQMAKADFVTSLALMGGSLFMMLYPVFNFPRFGEWGGLYSNPGFVPFLLGLALFLMSLYLFWRSLKRGGHQIRMTVEDLSRFLRSLLFRRLVICFGLFVLYYKLLGVLPFTLDTAFYLFSSMIIFGRGKWYFSLALAFAVSFAVYFIFQRVFLVPLPRGVF